MMDSDLGNADICRVCRSEGMIERPLFHPCICTGSIKWIHQECLVQWMRYSRKEYCELCGYRFSFTPIYSPDMPRRLPLKDIIEGLICSVGTAFKYWLHYSLVAIAWLGVVPLSACRTYRCLFSGSIESVLTLPVDLFSTDNIGADIFQGCFVVTCTLFAFIGLVWLREQILHGGGPDWLEHDRLAQPPIEEAAGVGVVNNNPEDVVYAEDVGVNNNVRQAEQEVENGARVIAAAAEPAEELDGNAGDENNWIPMEWDRAAEELTWERLLGLDGSLVFLEHVFWVISLNTLFIFIFAFCPYHMGLVALSILGMREPAAASHFEGLLTTLFGYCLVGMLLIILHKIATLFRLAKARRMLGLCYVVVKVSMLSVVEIGILPLVCGWWLDICSLAMFDATLRDREVNFKIAPGTSIFIHWLVGMVYVYYFASFVLLLREILRPGVLWFLRNLNDPDFSPIQEMIHLPILRHIRRLLLSAIIFGSAVLLMLWLPIRILRVVCPSFLPYTVTVNNEAQVNELSLELLLLQVILPALLEQSHTRIWLKAVVRIWCKAVAWLLDIHSYLLGDADTNNMQQPNNERNNQNNAQLPPAAPELVGGLGAAHHALLMREGPTGYQPYEKPSFFVARLILLLVLVCFSLIASSLVILTVPVWLGRHVMELWLLADPQIATMTSTTTTTHSLSRTSAKVHELYTAACGTYMCWLGVRAATLVLGWLPQGRAAIFERLKQWCVLGLKTIIVSAVLLGLIPLLFGLLLELVVIVPLRVPLHQTPILFIWQDWALGVLYTKIACAVTMMGPEFSLRAAIERAYRDGIRDMQLKFIFSELAAPVIICFGLILSVPYVIIYSIVPLFVSSRQMRNLIARRLYPFMLLVVVAGMIVVFQIRQFKKLYEHIKNDKYLVGQRLVNYDHRKTKVNSSASTAPPSASSLNNANN
ncbi:E3 ubiquitin-protein ligase MARCH6-like [Agrilus planipennis]|uniref:E3 ubiquitin-protein ligase MARCHF6 n=1 Tax=Agrilus planipennis TaxID=224129 RepID=A0A1W4WTW8_AGRPL|nr:E3 ubiquitin-protein ligase MARCH6 [Agrilus planipennis]XP_025836552.1 E3 ubiquitin-protein ligase MARCH6-like [Agrilus planipennis]